MTGSKHRRGISTLIAGASAALIVAGVAYAGSTAGGQPPRFYACVTEGYHTLHLTTASATCPDEQRKIWWDATGSGGTRGPAGAPGKPGKRGKPGKPGKPGKNGTNGKTVLDRATGTGPVGDGGGDSSNVVMSNNTFTNPAGNADNLFIGKFDYTPPATCVVNDAENPTVSVTVSLDGAQLTDAAFQQPFTPGGPPPSTFYFTPPVARIGLGTAPHTLTVTATNTCQGAGQTGSIKVEVDTLDAL